MNIAIVTGASSGLGAGYVRELDQGKLIKEKLDEIWVIARREDRLCALGKEVQTPLRILPLDLRKNESLGILQALLSSLHPDVRFLINAAGYGKIGSWKDISLEDASGMIDLNCRAAVCMTQKVHGSWKSAQQRRSSPSRIWASIPPANPSSFITAAPSEEN